MNWTAVVPMKQGQARKSRLSPNLSLEQRIALNEAMTAHVLDCVWHASSVAHVIALAPSRPAWNRVGWWRDRGREINVELSLLRRRWPRLLVIHGDLPLLRASDIDCLLRSADRCGGAIAPDRHGVGTNALALADDAPFAFAFGEGSRTLHASGAETDFVVVTRLGLSHDVDTPEDLALALSLGFQFDVEHLAAGLGVLTV